MKLDVPFFEITEVPVDIVDNIANNITEDDWFNNDYRNTVSNMEDTNSIPIHHTPLCATGKYTDEAIHSIKKELGYEKFYPLIEPVLNILKEKYTFNQYACFLARLRPKGKIGFHIDRGNFLEKCHRIHLPIVTDPDVHYVIDGTAYHWKRGALYEFDNTREHGVLNNSEKTYRIHLVINLYNL